MNRLATWWRRRRARQRFPTMHFLLDHPEVGPILMGDPAQVRARLLASEWWQATPGDQS